MKISIDGKDYPVRVTMGALLRYKHETGKDVGELRETDFEGLLTLLWCCLKSACAVDGVDFGLSLEGMADRLDTPTMQAAMQSLLGGGEGKKTP